MIPVLTVGLVGVAFIVLYLCLWVNELSDVVEAQQKVLEALLVENNVISHSTIENNGQKISTPSDIQETDT